MYRIEKNDEQIKSLTLDADDIDMLGYSNEVALQVLYQFCKMSCGETGYEYLTIYNNNYQNELEIKSILESDWLINENELSIELAKSKIKDIDIKLEEMEDILENTDDEEKGNYITNEIILYQYTRSTLAAYLLEKIIYGREKKKIKNL